MTVVIDEARKIHKPKKGVALDPATLKRKQLDEEIASRENRQTHEISNAELRRMRDHRRVHRGEKFADMGRDKDDPGKTHKARKRCEQDDKLFKALGRDRTNAMMLLRAAFKMITAGMGMQTFNPFRTRGGDGNIEKGAALMTLYWDWAREVQVRKLSHAQSLDVIVEGMSLREAAAYRNCHARVVRRNLIACLDVAIEMRIADLMRDED